ncbi:MAG: transglutaminase family protein, partial [Acidimicrobiales bacterium]
MSIHVAIEHRTAYRFDRPTEIGPHVVRLRPAPHSRTGILSYSLTITPDDHFLNWQQDPFGNFLARVIFEEPADELSITVDLIADMTPFNPFDFFVEDSAQHFPFEYDAATARDLIPYLEVDECGPDLLEWVDEVKVPEDGTPIVDFLVELNQRLNRDIAYTVRMAPGVQTPDETLRKRLGSCRDSGWLLVQILRRLGLASRFVSGYLVQLTADEPPLDGPPGPEADFTDLHAWCEVYIPGAGWIGLDPTSGLFASEGHIPLACTPHPSSAAPVEGATSEAEVEFEYANIVTRLHEDPRVTRPYSEDQWEAIDTLGRIVDARLVASDVRLTQGGEPTFVSVDDMDGAEWTIAADGEDKRARAWALTKRLAKRFPTSSPLLHCGQGKWYPGEPLPRWQLGIHWRRDDVALWSRGDLLADPWQPGESSLDEAEELALDLALRLGIPEECCVPGYEDPLADLLAEAQLPNGQPLDADVDATDPRLADAATRAAIVAELDERATQPVGWALPLHRHQGPNPRWVTTTWTFRRDRMMLLPGDSPMGLRLPLRGLAWAEPPETPERSPFEPVPGAPLGGPQVASVATAARVVPINDIPPTALCVERRDGRVHVFLPPLTLFEDAFELVGIIEAAAADLGVQGVLE